MSNDDQGMIKGAISLPLPEFKDWKDTEQGEKVRVQHGVLKGDAEVDESRVMEDKIMIFWKIDEKDLE